MRIGVAGVGRIGTMHAGNLASLDAVDEVVLFDPVPGRAAETAATVDKARAVDDLDTLLRDSDGVLVATPTTTHPVVLAAQSPLPSSAYGNTGKTRANGRSTAQRAAIGTTTAAKAKPGVRTPDARRHVAHDAPMAPPARP